MKEDPQNAELLKLAGLTNVNLQLWEEAKRNFESVMVETSKYGLTPCASGAMVQTRAFATVYQEIIEKLSAGISMPDVLDSVLQPHVEVYKKNLKPQADGKDVVVAGRIS